MKLPLKISKHSTLFFLKRPGNSQGKQLLENSPSQTTWFNKLLLNSIKCYSGVFPTLSTILLPILGIHFNSAHCHYTAEKQFKI